MRRLLLMCINTLVCGVALGNPVDCRNERGLLGYDEGFRQQEKYLADLLVPLDNGCPNLEMLVENVEIVASQPGLDSQFLHCRNLGINNATALFLEQQSHKCANTCITKGDHAGRLGAQMLCKFSQFADRYQYHVPLCDTDAKVKCAAAFRQHVDAHCNQLLTEDPEDYKQAVTYTCEVAQN